MATGNIYEDVVQARRRRAGRRHHRGDPLHRPELLDYVPYGATTEGSAAPTRRKRTSASMRKAPTRKGQGRRYIRLTNYCSGLCMPEIAAMGAMERLDMMPGNDPIPGSSSATST